MTVISIASAKGGSGKTIITTTLANAAASLGFKCLIVDADAATNGMTLFHLELVVDARDKNNLPSRGLFDIATGDTEFSNHLTPIEVKENLFFIPATFHARDTAETDPDELRSVLVEELDRLKAEFDWILFDAQAGVDRHALSVIEACDRLVIVSEYDPVSARGVERMKLLVARVQDPEETWVLFNKVLPDFAGKLGEFLAISNHLPPIMWTADVVRAYVRAQIALDMQKPNPFTLGILETASVLFGNKFRRQVDKWREETTAHLGGSVQVAIRRVDEQIKEARTKSGFRRKAELIQEILGPFAILFIASYVFTTMDEVTIPILIALGTVTIMIVFGSVVRTIGRSESIDSSLSNLYAQLEELHAIEQASLEELVNRHRNDGD